MATRQAKQEPENNLCHVVTVGTTPPGITYDVVEALGEDLKATKPRRVVVLATEDSLENANRLLKAVGLKSPNGKVRVIQSPQSLDEAYMALNEEIDLLFQSGVRAEEIILHYTAGTKVMSAGAVLAAVNNNIRSLRYLFAQGRNKKSEPVDSPLGSVLADRELRLATTLLLELRFRSSADILSEVNDALLTPSQSGRRLVLLEMAKAFEDWDRFRVKEFLAVYTKHEAKIKSDSRLNQIALKPGQAEALEKMALSATNDNEYPEELLIDLMNNAIRRLAERRPDDALIRLHRAAELYAQTILAHEFRIRTDDVDIRRVPPRSRTYFEAERRLNDAKIKIGLRKSFELLEILGHQVGLAFRSHAKFLHVLDERRYLVLAHGTRPATMGLALDFYREVSELLSLTVKDFSRRAANLQFPWIDNSKVLARLAKTPTMDESVLSDDQKRTKKASVPAPAPEAKAKKTSKARGKK